MTRPLIFSSKPIPGPLDRRGLLVGAAGFGLALTTQRRAFGQPDNPFTLGIASGSPAADGFVLWTRLAPEPLAPDGLGGMTGPADVVWEVATDEAMSQIVRKGVSQAGLADGYSVHVEVAGLAPDRPYWYRFTALGARTGIGRARTLPASGAPAQRAKLVLATCAHWEAGYFSAYRHMADENADLAVFLGDYIYEYSYPLSRNVVRRHDRLTDVTDLAGYRVRYAQQHTDPDLQALHASAPCVAIWDDHEVQNDYAGEWSQNGGTSPEDFLRRRAAAYRAFYENMPLRPTQAPTGPDMLMHGRFDWGRLARFHLLDSRQYRTRQPCPNGKSRRGHVAPDTCPDLADPQRTMLGFEQERWLDQGLASSAAQWNLIAQGVLFAPFVETSKDVTGSFTDSWGGYQAARQRLIGSLVDSRAANPVIFSGDLHAFLTADIRARRNGPVVAREFVATSVTSDGAPDSMVADQKLNPHVRFIDNKVHGYVSADLGHDRMAVRYRAVSDRTDPAADVSTLQSYVVEAARPARRKPSRRHAAESGSTRRSPYDRG